jgi:hypothetical protein
MVLASPFSQNEAVAGAVNELLPSVDVVIVMATEVLVEVQAPELTTLL